MIPFMFVDDMITGYIWRRLVSELAKGNGIVLTKAQVRQLANQDGLGCGSGCASVVTYQLKELIEQFLIWIEVRKGIDLATNAYYFGVLLDEVFQLDNFDPSKAPQYSRIIAFATLDANREVVRKIFRSAFIASKEKVREIKDQLKASMDSTKEKLGKHSFLSWLRMVLSKPAKPLDNTYVAEEKIDRDFEQDNMKYKDLVWKLAEKIWEMLVTLPSDHLEKLRIRLFVRLKRESLV